jgi:ribosome recycling factor
MWRWRVTIADGTGVQARNNIHVAMENLTEEDRKELEHELEEEMGERRRKKLACFQKTRHGIVKKADTAAASRSKVDSSLNLEDLV